MCLMQEAAAAGASLVVLPEMWNCPYSNDSFPIYAEDIDAGDSPRFACAWLLGYLPVAGHMRLSMHRSRELL